jgi:peptidoglycan/xylan/chitin deacetylase (PgdA/CDA1 family)
MVFFIADWFLNIVFKVLGVKRQKLCSVLAYHSVLAEERLRFARQMESLLQIATPIDVSQLGKECTDSKQVVVTFDDGFLSFRENALPELVKRKIPVVLFVPSRCLGERPRFATDYSIKEKEIVMSAEELLSLPHELVTIGSHYQTHPHLTLIDKNSATDEMVGSRKDLEILLGKPINFLAFPYGEYDDQILELSRQAGYQRVFSALPHRNKKDDFLWGRIDTTPHDWLVEFKLKAAGAYRWLPWADFLKRKAKTFSGGLKNLKLQPRW